MATRKKVVLTLGVIIFSIGILFGVALFGSTTWGDFEATMFDVSMSAKASLTTLRCPVMMTTGEQGMVTATFKNSLDRPVEFFVRTHISHGFVTLKKEIDSRIPVAVGETESLEWPVTPDDAAYGRLILIRMRLFPKYPLPARIGTCGIIVLDLPNFTGNQIFAFTLGISLLSIAVGMGIWIAGNRPLSGQGQDVARAMTALAGCVLVGTIVSFMGLWLAGALTLVVTVLLIGTIIGYFIRSR